MSLSEALQTRSAHPHDPEADPEAEQRLLGQQQPNATAQVSSGHSAIPCVIFLEFCTDLVPFVMNTERHCRWMRSNRIGPTVIAG